MKQFLISLFFIVFAFNSNSLMGQETYQAYDSAKDTIDNTILGSATHSGEDCGTRPSDSSDKPVFRIEFVDLLEDNFPTTAASFTYQAKVKVNVNAPYKKQHTFNFTKKGGKNLSPNWEIKVPCYIKSATFTIDLQYKDKGKFKALNANSKNQKNQLILEVDFIKEKVYAPDQNKAVVGTFGKTFASTGRKLQNADKAKVRILIK